MKRRKIISVVTSIMLTSLLASNAMLPFSALAEEIEATTTLTGEVTEGFLISVADTEVYAGNTIDVPVAIQSSSISALKCKFDMPAGMELVGITSSVNAIAANLATGTILYAPTESAPKALDAVVTLKVKVTSGAKTGKIGVSSVDAAEEYLAITPQIKTGTVTVKESGFTAYIDDVVCDLTESLVEVPIRLDTAKEGIASFIANLSVDNGAQIMSVSPKAVELNPATGKILWAPLTLGNKTFSKADVFATVTVKLPEGYKSGDVFNLKLSDLDAANNDLDTVLLAKDPVMGKIIVEEAKVVIKPGQKDITWEEFRNLKTVKEVVELEKIIPGTEDMKVIEVPIQVLKNKGMFSGKFSLKTTGDAVILGYKDTTLPNSSVVAGKNNRGNLVWTNETKQNSIEEGTIATALIAVPDKAAEYELTFDSAFSQFSSDQAQDISYNLMSSTIKIGEPVPTTTEATTTTVSDTPVTTTTTSTPATEGLEFKVNAVVANYSNEDQVVEVPVMVAGNPGFAAAKFDFNFTAGMSIAKEAGIKEGLLKGLTVGNTSVLWIDGNGSDITADGELFTLNVTVPANTPVGVYPIGLTIGSDDLANDDYKSVVAEKVEAGSIEIIDGTTTTTTTTTTTVDTEVTTVSTPEETTVSTADTEETTVSTADTEETTVSTADTEETTVSTADTEETTVSTADTEETTVSTADTEETTVSTADTEETTVSTADTEETTVSTADTEETTVTTVDTEETTTTTTVDTEETTTTTTPVSSELKLSVADVTVDYSTEDQLVAVPVSIEGNPGIMGAKFKFTFEAGMEIDSLVAGSLSLEGATHGKTSVVWVGNSDITEDGVLLTLMVKVPAGTAPGKYAVNLELPEQALVSFDYTTYESAEIVNGSIEVTGEVTTTTTTADTTVDTSVTTADTTVDTSVTTADTTVDTSVTTVDTSVTTADTTVTTVSSPEDTTTTTTVTTPVTALESKIDVVTAKEDIFVYAEDDNFDLSDMGVTVNATGILFVNGVQTRTETRDVTPYCSIKEIPSQVYDKSKFMYTVNIVATIPDTLEGNLVAEYLNMKVGEEVLVGTLDVIIGQRGDANLDHDVSTLDAVSKLNYINALNLGQTYNMSVDEDVLGDQDKTNDFAVFLANVDESGDGVATVDVVKLLNYINALNLATDPTTVKWEDILSK